MVFPVSLTTTSHTYTSPSSVNEEPSSTQENIHTTQELQSLDANVETNFETTAASSNKENNKDVQRAEKIIQRCLMISESTKALPKEQTLIALVKGNISVDIFCAWAKTAIEKKQEEEDEQPDHQNTELNTSKQLAQTFIQDLFFALQKEEAPPLTSLLRQGKLSVTQWQAWFNSIQTMDETSLDDPIHKGPFLFHKKLQAFLEASISIQCDHLEGYGVQKHAYQIMTALKEDRLTATQLDQWMRNPDFDLSLIAKLSKRINTKLTTEQIIQLEKLIVEETKLLLAIDIKEISNQLGDYKAGKDLQKPLNARAQERTKKQERLFNLDKDLLEDEAFFKKINEAYISRQATVWSSLYQSKNNLNHLTHALTPEEINRLEKFRTGCWQQKIGYCALLTLLKNGFSLDQAQSILQAENHHSFFVIDPINYLHHLSVIAFPGISQETLEKFNFLGDGECLLVAALDNTHDDMYVNPLRSAYIAGKIECKQLVYIFEQIRQSDFFYEQNDDYFNIIKAFKNFDFSNFLEPLVTDIEDPVYAKAFIKLAPFCDIPNAIQTCIDLKKNIGLEIYGWLAFAISPEHLSLPFALKNARALGIKLSLPTQDGITNRKRYLNNLCLLFGTHMWEYGNAITQALTEGLISPNDLRMEFLESEGYFYENENIKKFLSHVLPRILKKEITFSEVLTSLHQLTSALIKKNRAFFTEGRLNALTQIYCQSTPLEDVLKIFLKDEEKTNKRLQLFTDESLIAFLEDGTITLEKILEWLDGPSPIHPEQIKFFCKALGHVSAGRLDLETLESWMRPADFDHKSSLVLLLERSHFDPQFAQLLYDKKIDPPVLNAAQIKEFTQHAKAQQKQQKALATAREIDRYMQNANLYKAAYEPSTHINKHAISASALNNPIAIKTKHILQQNYLANKNGPTYLPPYTAISIEP